MFNKNRSDQPAWNAPDQRVFVSISEPTIVLVTVCTQGRKRWLAQADIHQALLKTWTQAAAWMIGRYVLMPDHLHFFCAPTDLMFALDRWVAYWKRLFARANPERLGAWQRLSWHHRLRRDESYQEKWEYVRNNPVRAGFVLHPNDWPYQGELNVLRW